MSKKQQPSNRRTASAGIAICFLAAVIFAGTYAWRDYHGANQQAEDTTDDANEAPEQTEEPAKSANTDQLIVETPKEEPDTEHTEAEEPAESRESDASGENSGSAVSTPSSGSQRAVNFTQDSDLLWPVNGQVLMNYSMDKTVYFATLDQYKYNPALVISCAEGDQVICGASGIVKSIDSTAQTGTTVNVDLGNGYELFVGQLKDVPVNTGQYVDANTVIGYVSQPTKYYSEEGCNVYYEMRKDGQPVNPLDFVSE